MLLIQEEINLFVIIILPEEINCFARHYWGHILSLNIVDHVMRYATVQKDHILLGQQHSIADEHYKSWGSYNRHHH